MPILIRNISLNLDEPEDLLPEKVARRLRIPVTAIGTWSVLRRSLDARDKPSIVFVYNVGLTLADGHKREIDLVRRLHRQDVAVIKPEEAADIQPGTQPLRHPPVVIGFGPAGMFAALLLAEYGYRPLVLERGQPILQRHRDVYQHFYREGRFNPQSNLLFGEGGAGTYSDGKLYSRVGDPRTEKVYAELVAAGADARILIDGKPHIGSDRLPTICTNIREKIERLGGRIQFGAHVTDLLRDESGRIGKVILADNTQIDADVVILATGHSARDMYELLLRQGIDLQAKPFQMGLRIQHPQEVVDRWQYGTLAGHPKLPPADYHLVAKGAAGSLGDVFSFCMCPGGVILPANESAGLIVTNGASESQRSGRYANSALVVTLTPEQFGHEPLAGIRFQEKWEKAAYGISQGYAAPAQRVPDFLAGRPSEGDMQLDHPIGAKPADLHAILPQEVAAALDKAVRLLARKLRGFDSADAILAGPETRASSPVRIVRDLTTRASPSANNLYPAGEGAGYAGGITSAAVDGLRTAEVIIAKHRIPTR